MLKHMTRSSLMLLSAGIMLVIVAVILIVVTLTGGETIEWQLTLIGSNRQEIVLDYDDIIAMNDIEARGGYFSTVGVVYGPYDVKGTPLMELCDIVGGMTENDVLLVSARDGYSSVFDYDQVSGNIDTFVPDPIRQVPHGELEFILMYEMDGESLSETDGRPFRLAITGTEELITEGHWWVKWVDKLEIRHLPPMTDVVTGDHDA